MMPKDRENTVTTPADQSVNRLLRSNDDQSRRHIKVKPNGDLLMQLFSMLHYRTEFVTVQITTLLLSYDT